MKKFCGLLFSRIIEHEKQQWKEMQSFQWKKNWPIFLFLSNMASFREQVINFHNVFW